MAELTFGCTGAHVVRYAATPTFALSLNITESTGVRLHAVALRCQIRIEPHRRRYTADEARRLNELFGDTHSWGETARPLQLATLTSLVPGFKARTEVELQVPCSYDLEVASARYLQVLEDGIIPLLLLFSGTVFVDHGHTYSVELIPWSQEVPFPMPVRVWHDVIEEHFPGSAWLRCSRQTLGALAEFKSAYALPTWDAALSALLASARLPVAPGAGAYRVDYAPDWGDAEPAWRDAEPAWRDAQPAWRDAEPELRVVTPEVAAPQDTATRDTATQDAAPEGDAAEDAVPEPAGAAPEPQDTAPAVADDAAADHTAADYTAAEDTATQDTAAEDTATRDTATQDTAAEDAAPVPEEATAAPDEVPQAPQDTAPEPQAAAPPEPEGTPPVSPDAAPEAAATARRRASTARRRTGTAGRTR